MDDEGGLSNPPLLQTRNPIAPEQAPGDPDPQQCLQPREEPEASPAMAETGEETLEIVVLPQPQLLEERGAPHDPAGCGPTPRIPVGGDRDYRGTKAGQEDAPPPSAGLEAMSVSMATGSGLYHGRQPGAPSGPGAEKARATWGAERLGSEAVAETKAEEVSAEMHTVVSVSVEEEEVVKQEMAAAEKPVGEEIDMVEENGGVEAVNEEARPRPPNMDLRMNPLEAIQLELDIVNAQADRAFQQLEHKFGRMRRHYLERRNYIIQHIPGFWVAAFRNHPQLSPMIRGQDAQMLRYITNLEVKELRHPRTGCKFKFFFRRNPYFRNKLIVKEYEVRASGRVVSLSTPIVWRQGHEPQSFIRRNQDVVCSFFTWFSDHSLPESDKIAEIIKEDLWPNPLQYYLSREGARRARRRPIREPVEIPRPFGFQSG